jgi:hypothetical protein
VIPDVARVITRPVVVDVPPLAVVAVHVGRAVGMDVEAAHR